MKDNTKQKIRNAAKTGGKWTLQGIKFAGKETLSVVEMTTKGIANIAGDPKSRRILAGAGTLAASVVIAPSILLGAAALNYMCQGSLIDKNISPIKALKSTMRGTNSILKDVLDLAAPIVEVTAHETSKLAKKGKEALDR